MRALFWVFCRDQEFAFWVDGQAEVCLSKTCLTQTRKAEAQIYLRSISKK